MRVIVGLGIMEELRVLPKIISEKSSKLDLLMLSWKKDVSIGVSCQIPRVYRGEKLLANWEIHGVCF